MSSNGIRREIRRCVYEHLVNAVNVDISGADVLGIDGKDLGAYLLI